MNCSRAVMSLLAAGTMAAAVALTDVAGSASLACVDTNAKSLVSACGCKHLKLLSNRLLGRRCCYTIYGNPSADADLQTGKQAAANTARSDFQRDLVAQPTDSTAASEDWQNGYEHSATEQTGFSDRPLAEEQSEPETTEEAFDKMTGQQEDVNHADAEDFGAAEAYSYESALRQTTEQFHRSYQPDHFVGNGLADEPNETDEGSDDQWRPEDEDINEQQMLDEQANENVPGEQTDEQFADDQPTQQPLDEQSNDDGQPVDLDHDANNDQQHLPAEDAMPDVPDSDVPDSNAQYDPYLTPETESQSNHFSASPAAQESSHSASHWQQYESQYDPYAQQQEQSGMADSDIGQSVSDRHETPSQRQPGDLVQQSEAWRSELFSQTDSVAPNHPIETYETATPESQYGAWEDPQAGIPVEAASDGQCSPQTTQSFSDQGTQTPEGCYRYQYEYYPSDSAPRYEYTPSEPAYGCPQASDMQQDDGSAYRQPSETTESLSDDATGNDQFQAEAAEQYQRQQYGMDYDEAFNAAANQSGRDQFGNDIQSDMQTESLDQDSDSHQRSWDAEQSYEQHQDSSSENEQSDSENQHWDSEQMQFDDQSYQHVPYQESPYDATDEGNDSHEQSWHGSDAQYPESNPQITQLEQTEQTYQYDYTYDDFRADDPNFKPNVPPEVTNNQAWETPVDDEPSNEATGHTDHWSGAAHSSEEEYSDYSGYQWDAGYGKYGASEESAGCDLLEQGENPSDYQALEGHRRYEDSFEPNDGWHSAEEASDKQSDEPSTPTEQTIDDGQQFDWPGTEDKGRLGAEDDDLSQPADRQIDASDDSQTAGDNDESEQYDNSPRYWGNSADSQGQLPATEEDEVGDSFSERQQSEGWVPSSRQPEDAMPAADQSGDGQDEQSSPPSPEAESNWIPLPYYRYPFTPTSTEHFLPPHVYSDSSLNFLGR